MILFINVIITSERLYFPHLGKRTRYRFTDPDRLDVFKYTLASLAAIPYWSKCIFYVALADEFKHREEELKQYIFGLFNCSIVYHNQRNEYQVQWKKSLTEVMDGSDRLIWFMCNDDHVFIDYDLKTIEDMMNIMPEHEHATFMFSHWCEHLSGVFASPHKEQRGSLMVYPAKFVDSICVVTKELLYHWWYNSEYKNRWMPRSDNPSRGGYVKSFDAPTYVPLKECLRHFDGYYHVDANPNRCPPLEIPPGFFENNIKISLYENKKPNKDWVLFNPLLLDYSVVSKDGADYRGVKEDIPLFWNNRISEIRTGTVVDQLELIEKRNEAVWNNAKAKSNHLDKEIIMSIAGR